MDLEEMQLVWSKMDQELENQKKITNKIILKMTQERYANKFRKIAIYESLGAFVCFVAGLYLLLNFYKLDVWYLIACGVLSILYLFVMPFLVLRPLYSIKNIKIDKNSFSETLRIFLNSKKQLLLVQRIGVFTNIMAVLFILPTFGKILKNKDFFTQLDGVTFYLSIAFVFVLMTVVSKWGYKCYKNISNAAENILKEIDDVDPEA